MLYLQKDNYMHLDLALRNLLLDHRNHLVLADFGLVHLAYSFACMQSIHAIQHTLLVCNKPLQPTASLLLCSHASLLHPKTNGKPKTQVLETNCLYKTQSLLVLARVAVCYMCIVISLNVLHVH
jgi:serine/threonine protein kinase